MSMRERFTWENSLRVGAAVDVWWGYGSGFRAKGRGVIDAIFPKSFRVRLTEAASGASWGSGMGWPAGFVVKGIPRAFASDRWHPNLCVEPIEQGGHAEERTSDDPVIPASHGGGTHTHHQREREPAR